MCGLIGHFPGNLPWWQQVCTWSCETENVIEFTIHQSQHPIGSVYPVWTASTGIAPGFHPWADHQVLTVMTWWYRGDIGCWSSFGWVQYSKWPARVKQEELLLMVQRVINAWGQTTTSMQLRWRFQRWESNNFYLFTRISLICRAMLFFCVSLLHRRCS